MAHIPNCPKCNKPLPITKVQSDLKSQHGKMITCIDSDKVCYESKNGKNQHIECKNLPLCEHYMPYPHETNAKGQIIESGVNKNEYL